MAAVQSLIVLVLCVITLYLSLSAFKEIAAMIGSGQDENLKDNWRLRVASVMQMVFGHKKVLDEKSSGIMHMWFLYGFLILTIGHIEVILYGLTSFLQVFAMKPFLYKNLTFMPTALWHIYSFTQDFMAFFVLVMVFIALYRRLSGRVKRLKRSTDAEIILYLIGGLYITFFGMVGSEVFLTMKHGEIANSWHWYFPISSLIALNISSFSPVFVNLSHQFFWWMHLLIFLGFAIYIPRSKHMHLVAAGPNIYFRHLDGVGKLPKIDFENCENFGVSKVTQLSWKSLLDTFACTECGRCDSICPANLTAKPLQPQKILHDIKHNLRYKNWEQIKTYRDGWGRVIDAKKKDEAEFSPKIPLISRQKIDSNDSTMVSSSGQYKIEGQVHLDEIWSCTTCGACIDACPVLIDSVPTNIMQMRQNLILMEANDYPKELNAAFKGLENQSNPWGMGQDKREDWCENLDVKKIDANASEEVEYLFWVGCAGATDDRAKKVQQSLVRILKAAKVDFAILGCKEKCTGDSARRMGNEYLFDMLAQDNVDTLKKYKFKKIFTACPHCFNSIKNEYKDYGGNYSVLHHTQLIGELLKDNRLSLSTKNQLKHITFHDPCYLGRYNDEYDNPREILKSLPGTKLSEMKMNKRKSFCCGAGGGKMFMEENLGSRINEERTQQALDTKADTIAVGCPFCMTMLKDGVAAKGKEEQVEVKDIAEIVAQHLPDDQQA